MAALLQSAIDKPMMNTKTKVAGHPMTSADFDGDDAAHECRVTSGDNTLITRRSAVNFGVLCLIDATQRDHAARMQAGMELLEIDVSSRLAKLAYGEGNGAAA
jgi:hypothetical protein